MKTDKKIINYFEDIIRQRGAMDRIISDQAQIENSGRVLDLRSAYIIGRWNNEPHQQQQNYAEGKYRHIKCTTNYMKERSGSPLHCCLFALLYVCFIHTSLDRLTSTTPDISPILRFYC